MDTRHLTLARALQLSPTTRLAVVGAGGKTTALFQLARQIDTPVLLTTTTHLALEELRMADHHWTITEASDLEPILPDLHQGVNLLTGPEVQNSRVRGLDITSLEKLAGYAALHRIPLLIEADGSRQRPLKAPACHEPPVPQFVDRVVVVAGLSGLNKPLTADWVFRPEIFSELTGVKLEDPITPQAIVDFLCHPQGGLKNIPQHSCRIALLNQVDAFPNSGYAQNIATSLLPTYNTVIVSTLRLQTIYSVHRPIAGIILAAGASSRMNSTTPKVLLPWQAEPLIRHVARTAIQARLYPVLVVTGAHASQVESALTGLPVQIIHNPRWQFGQSTSIRAGLQALPKSTGAAFFLLADQPQIPAELLNVMQEHYARTLPPILAPRSGQMRGNPVLFDQVTFTALQQLQGDSGGKQIFAQFPLSFVDWPDSSIFLDIDTPQDYLKLVESSDTIQ